MCSIPQNAPQLTNSSASTATIVRIFYIKVLTDTDDYSWEGIHLIKWSMVEPAIAITAMNIATLRPLFKNVLFFASKQFDSSIDDDDDNLRPPGDRRSNFAQRNSVSAKDYSVEFAELLGLSRVGVTTHISAGGGSEAERDQPPIRWTAQKNGRGVKEEKQRGLNHDSESELSSILGDADVQERGAVNWTLGIKTTTVITHQTN
jgi:hypothetical protein